MQKFINSGVVCIQTRYLGPSNTRGGRIVADAGMKRRVTVKYDHSLSQYGAHAKAAKALCDKFEWRGDMTAGGTETGYVFVFHNAAPRDTDTYTGEA